MEADKLPKLTPQQNKAVLYYCSSCAGNKTASYRKAYDCSKMSEKTIYKEASELFKNPHITPWIDYYNKVIQHHTENEIKYTRTEFMEDLFRIRAKTEDNAKTVSVALKATELMGKASGLLKDNAENNTSVFVQMGQIEKDGKVLEFEVGESVD